MPALARRPTFLVEQQPHAPLRQPGFLVAPPPSEPVSDDRKATTEPDVPIAPPAASPDALRPDAGWAARLVEAETEARLCNERLARALDVLRFQSSRLAEEAKADAVEIGFQVARRILEKEVSSDVSALMALARSALRKAAQSRHVRLRVSGEDHKLLAPALGQVSAADFGIAELEVVPDATLQRGDVVVETENGEIDGRLDTRLRETRLAVFDGSGESR